MIGPHMLRCTIEDGWPVWSIDCPYDADDTEKPCAMWENWEADTPAKFIPGCGLIHWHGFTGADVDEMAVGDIGPIPAPVDPHWTGDGWTMVPHAKAVDQ